MSKNKIALLCEGGGTKAAYTAAVLQCLLDNDINVDYCAGISAGAEVLLPYVSKQPERLHVTGVDSAAMKGVIGIKPLIKERGLFGIKHVCKYIEEQVPLDYETFMANPTQLDIGLYNLSNNTVEYWPKEKFDRDEQKLMVASCSLFLLNKPIEIEGTKYMDAGLVDMIPIEQSIRQGSDKHIFISTKEENYVRKPAPGWQLTAAKLIYKNDKTLVENLRNRHINYEKQWSIVKDLEKQGNALVLRPSEDQGISRYTTDRDKLEKWYQLGYDDTLARLDMIKKFIEE